MDTLSSIKEKEKSITTQISEIQLQDDFVFPKKRDIKNSSYFMGKVNVVSNLFSVKFNDEIYNYTVYGISVEQVKKDENRTENYLIRNITRGISEVLNNSFRDYFITGNTLFGIPILRELTKLKLNIWFKLGEEVKILSDEDMINFKEDDQNLFVITFNKRFNINDQVEKGDQHIIRRFINLTIGRNLRKMKYIRSDNRQIYYNNDDYINLQDGSKRFVCGFKIATDLYEGSRFLVKTIPKFRMIRDETYQDYYNFLNQKHSRSDSKLNEYFRDICIGRKGIRDYNQQPIKIDDVIYASPSELFFEESPGQSKSLAEYYVNKWKKKVENRIQPIFVTLKSKTNEKIYFLPQFVSIVGVLENEGERINASRLIMKPQQKLERIKTLIKELKSSQGANNVDYRPQNAEGLILTPPTIQFGNDTRMPTEKGIFDCKNIIPIQNENLDKWLIMMLGVSQEEAKNVFDNMCLVGGQMGMKVSLPDTISLVADMNYDYNTYFVEYFDFLNKQKQKDPEKFDYQMIMLVKSPQFDVYRTFKNSLNNSGLGIPSQVIVLKKDKKKDFAVYINILFQIWVKRDLSPWRIKHIPIKGLVVLSYAVTKLKGGKVITSLSISHDKSLMNYFYLSEIHDCGSEFMSNVISKLVKIAVKYSVKLTEMDKIEHFIVYREGLNPFQRKLVVNWELNPLLKTIEETCQALNNENKYKGKCPNPRITFIFVNKQNDTKLFQDEAAMQEGMEVMSSTSLNTNRQVSNIPIGTLVESNVIIKDLWEFYLNSSYTHQGTNNSTHYVVGYDNSNVSPEAIYRITYDLTFTYYNNPKCVRIPAPLYRIIRRNNFTRDNLDKVIDNKFINVDISA